jgi:hypothetical protein
MDVTRRSHFLAARPLLAGLFLFAIMLRALVPAGFMIGTGASGAPGLILCPGVTPPPVHPMAMHGHAHAPGHDPATHRESPCPFAALVAPALPPAPPAVAPPPAAPPQGRLEVLLRTAAALGLAAPPPPATGPPAAV